MQRCSCKCPNGQMAFLAQAVAGKPRYGPEHWLMKQTRSQFKLTLRYCKQHDDNIRADMMASIVWHQRIT